MARLLALALARAAHGVPSSWPRNFNPSRPEDLHDEYNAIFPTGNRNAASHKWSAFILHFAPGMTAAEFESVAMGYCPVSGSPVRPNDGNRYIMHLPHADGSGVHDVAMHFCCSPCVCDTQDFIWMDTRTVQLVDTTKVYNFAVIGNPCKDTTSGWESKQFSNFGREKYSLKEAAPELECDGETLVGAPLSDRGHVIIGLVLGPQGGGQDAKGFDGYCSDRAAAGFNSGMGQIFREVAKVTPVTAGEPLLYSPAGMVTLLAVLTVEGLPVAAVRAMEPAVKAVTARAAGAETESVRVQFPAEDLRRASEGVVALRLEVDVPAADYSGGNGFTELGQDLVHRPEVLVAQLKAAIDENGRKAAFEAAGGSDTFSASLELLQPRGARPLNYDASSALAGMALLLLAAI